MKLTPDDFPVVMDRELRAFWVRYRDVDVRRLILEVHRAREVERLCLGDAQTAQRDLWEKQYGLVGVELQKIADRLFNEKVRLGAMGGLPVQTPIKQ
jgi:hypothetical protein